VAELFDLLTFLSPKSGRDSNKWTLLWSYSSDETISINTVSSSQLFLI
jgi:hypothetical protein